MKPMLLLPLLLSSLAAAPSAAPVPPQPHFPTTGPRVPLSPLRIVPPARHFALPARALTFHEAPPRLRIDLRPVLPAPGEAAAGRRQARFSILRLEW
ncbi:MAG TPA: hypothetical protein VHC86_13070 [Opitutaceae bacterium]|nr:hypothetical protein [Opitutaceae bacterium]